MARTKTPKTAWRASAAPIKETWEIEFERSLATHGPTASSNHIYPSTVHRGFDAHFTAEELTRRYPAFEETEQHREFLARSRSARLLLPGERDNYFTPEQLWEEDDRLRGVNQFANSGEASWVHEIADETEDEDEEDESQAVEQRVVVQEPDDESDEDFNLPLSFDADDHATTVTTVISEHTDVQDFVTSLDLSTTATLLTISNAFIDGTLAIALCGHQKAHETVPEDAGAGQELRAAPVNDADSSHPVRLDTDAAGDALANSQEGSNEDQAFYDEWNVVLKDDHLPTVAFLSGSKNLGALMAAIEWDAETTLATVQRYSDGRIVLLMVGQQKRVGSGKIDEIEYASLWAEVFRTVQKATRHGAFPKQHAELASLLKTAGQDLVKAGLLDDFVLPAKEGEGASGPPSKEASISDAARTIAAGQGELSDEDFVEALQEQIKETQQALDVAKKDTQPSLSHSPSRMTGLLERPSVDYQTLELADKHEQALKAVNMASAHPSTATPVRPLRNPMLAHRTIAVMPATAGLAPPPMSTTNKKRPRDASTPPSDSSPDPQKAKKRKVAAVRTKGKGKA